jgi:KDO2-lipid IV(A) lauroyltransferase
MLAEYGIVQLVRLTVLGLPRRLGLRMGEGLGKVGHLLFRRRRREAEKALAAALPEMSPGHVRRTIRDVFKHLGRGLVETACAKKVISASNLLEHVTIHNEACARRILDSGRPAIWVTGHFGVWEVMASYFTLNSIPFASVYRPVKNPLIDRLVRRTRRHDCQQLIERKGALRAMIRAIKRDKRHVVLLVDQHVRKGGIWVPFFGRPAATTPAPAAVALQTGAPIVFWYSRRLPGTYRFELTFDAPITATSTGDRAADIEHITRRISQRLEEVIRETPEQWLWLHRRWRTPPPEVLDKETADDRVSRTTA